MKTTYQSFAFLAAVMFIIGIFIFTIFSLEDEIRDLRAGKCSPVESAQTEAKNTEGAGL